MVIALLIPSMIGATATMGVYFGYAPGAMIDYEIVVGPHPDSGFLRGTYAPDNDFFDIIGLTSKLCPEEPVAVEEESWGAVKSMYG